MESELEKLTNNYDEKNFIGRTQFGKLYRGKINSPVNGVEPQDVTVKIWDEEREKLYVQADCYAMFKVCCWPYSLWLFLSFVHHFVDNDATSLVG